MRDKNGKYLEVNINNINLDLQNPRVPLSIRKNEEESNENEINNDILEYLIKTGSIPELMLSIGENGFFAGEALLLINDPINTGKYIVVEGNRRVTALKLLHDPSLAQISKNRIHEASELRKIELNEITEIPSIVFEKRDDILKYLGYRHITGIKNWKALEKARYMNDLYQNIMENDPKSHDDICQEIAKSIGSQRSYVNRILKAFDIYQFIENNDFFDIGINDQKFHFVNLSDSLNKNNIRSFLIDEDGHFKEDNIVEWTEWIFKENAEGVTRLNGTSESLAKLDSVLSKPIAMEAFRAKKISLDQAYLMAENVDDILNDSLENALNSLYEADRVLTKIKDFDSLRSFDENILEIRKIAKKIFDYRKDQMEFNDELY